jgi:hypothetical protein
MNHHHNKLPDIKLRLRNTNNKLIDAFPIDSLGEIKLFI